METAAVQKISKPDWDLALNAGLLSTTLSSNNHENAIANFAIAIRGQIAQETVSKVILNWPEIKILLATQLRPMLKAQAACHEPECCSYGQSRGSCPCSQDEDALIAADLLNASNKAERAQHSLAFKTLRN